jgi:peroxiredoxin
MVLVAVKGFHSRSQNTPTEGRAGLAIGEAVELPELSTLDGSPASLKGLAENYMLCAVFTTKCSGCAQDAPLWQDLAAEAKKRHTAFRMISLDDDRDRVKRFAEAYEFANLSVLFDPNHQKLAQAWKITFVPQYLLLSSSGRVLGRWEGIQRLEPQHQSPPLDQFFKPAGSN